MRIHKLVADELDRIVKTTAKITIEDIRSLKLENEFYRQKEVMEDYQQTMITKE